MTSHELLQKIREKDIRLAVSGDQLTYDAPIGVMTEALVAEIRQHKVELLTLLQQPGNPCSDRSPVELAPRKAPSAPAYIQKQRVRLEALLKAKYHCQKCGHNGAYDGSLEVTDALVVACRPCLGLRSLVEPKKSETTVEPLPTLRLAKPGYKCMEPACVQALRELPDGMVGCGNGHVFVRD
jgi:hypothetical protein